MEDKRRPFRPIPPGEILKEELDSRGWIKKVTNSDLRLTNYEVEKKVTNDESLFVNPLT